MSLAFAHQNKTKKTGDSKKSTLPKHSSYPLDFNNMEANDSPNTILNLQRAIGNQAVQRLLRSNTAGFEFSKVSIIQPKLKVSQPGDVYEQEADKVVEQVMRISVPSNTVSYSASNDEEHIARKCAACEIKEEEEDEKMSISRKPSTTSNLDANDEILDEINTIRSKSGSSIDTDTKNFMESRFATYDFSNVRIHTDEMAARSAKSVNATAYTIGNDIMFDEGKFQPNTLEGRRLLAHELTHVVQQKDTLVTPQYSQLGHHKNLSIEAVRNDAERSADQHAIEIMAPKIGISSILTTSSQVQRQAAHPQSQPSSAVSTQFLNQKNHQQLLSQAIDQMSGPILLSHTMAGRVIPILREMVKRITWVDSSGKEFGGGRTSFEIHEGASRLMLNLRMLLDDRPGIDVDPPAERRDGSFQTKGPTNGELTLFVRNATDVNDLSETLYHESLHMMSWLINRSGPTLVPSGGRKSAEFALDKSHYKQQIANIRLHLDKLAKSVNPRRAAGHLITITQSQLDWMAGWLFEEVQVRAEAEVFKLALASQIRLDRRGEPEAIPQTLPLGAEFVDLYVFENSKVFLPTDRTKDFQDQETLRILGMMLDGWFQQHVRRRFNLRFYDPNPNPSKPNPEESYTDPNFQKPYTGAEYKPPPLTPPEFRPLPTP